MQIQCTRKLLDRMKSTPAIGKKSVSSAEKGSASTEENELYRWHANIITADRRKVLVFVNNFTRLVVIVYRPKPSVYKNPGAVLEDGIRELFTALGIHDDVTAHYLEKAGPCEITATGTRSQVARMNKMAEDVAWHAKYFRSDKMLQTTTSVALADFPYTEGKGYSAGEYFIPWKRLCEALCSMMGYEKNDWERVRSARSYRLRITLDLDHYDIHRVIEAPANAQFWQLHQAIQYAFGWFDYHLHMFTVYDGEVAARQHRMYYNKKRRMVILDHGDPEAAMYFDPDEQEIQSDRGLMLRDVFENIGSCVYSYDFGDNWEHVITVEERCENGSGKFVLVEMQGERPPEDVGGEGGFEEYMRVISDENDPEYEATVRWAQGTGADEEAASVEVINRRLGYLI